MKKLFIIFVLLSLLFQSSPGFNLVFAQSAGSASSLQATDSTQASPDSSNDSLFNSMDLTASGSASSLQADSARTLDKNSLTDLAPTPAEENGSAILRGKIFIGKIKKNFQYKERIKFSVLNSLSGEFNIVVLDKGGNKADIQITEADFSDKIEISLTPKSTFTPGKYTVQVVQNGQIVSSQDFTWGVLAINSDKSIYFPSEKANLAMAVLDENGEIVCDALLRLEVKAPDGQTKELSTTNGEVKINSICGKKEFSLTPDYEANYQIGESTGDYLLNLTAETKNGSYSIQDKFQVQNDQIFDVRRIAPTRIYPPLVYPVSIQVKANKDFKGQVTEVLPGSFSGYMPDDQEGVIKPSSIRVVSVNSISSETQSVLGAKALSMPFAGEHEVTLGFSEVLDLIDPAEKGFYQKYGLLGHDGIDFAIPEGTPISSVDDGEVVSVDKTGPYGWTIVVKHDFGKTYYGHLSEFKVEVGQKVSKAEEIALSGKTGLTTGPHLHFGVELNNPDIKNGYFGKTNPAPLLGLPDQGKVLAASTQDTQVQSEIITWDIDVKEGDVFTLGYLFQAPNISPQFYTIGPARFFNLNQDPVFEEGRMWQIASDSPGILQFVGFEEGLVTAGAECQAIGTTQSFQTGTKRTGGYALRTNPATTATGYCQMQGYGATGATAYYSAATAYHRFYFRYASKVTAGSEEIFSAWNSSGALKMALRLESTGKLMAFASDGTTQMGSTGNTVLASGTWYRIEVKVGTAAAGSGVWEVKINGTTELGNSTGTLTTTNNGRASLGGRTNRDDEGVDFFYDDFMVRDDAYPGPGKIQVMQGDGGTPAYTAWTGDYTAVDEIPVSSSDYVTSAGAASAETITLETAASAGVSGTINAVKSYGYIGRAGTSPDTIRVRLRSGSTDNDTTNAYTPTSTYVQISKIYETDPADAGAWTTGDLDGLEVGAIVVTNGTNNARGGAFNVMVAYSDNAEPSLSISEPNGSGDTVTIGDDYEITYALTDSDSVATVDFYYDSDGSGLNGTAISGECAGAGEGSPTAYCTWDTTGMSAGSYYVYGIATDVDNQVFAYSPGQITINNPAANLSGTIYSDDGSTVYKCSTDGNLTVNLRVNGSGSDSDLCDADTGAWAINSVSVISGQTVAVYISGGSVRGSTILVSDGTEKSDIHIFQDRVILRDDVNGSITNTEIGNGQVSGTTDDMISVSGGALTVDSTYETHIYSGDTFAPGGNVTTGKLHIPSTSTYTSVSETLELTGTGTGSSRPFIEEGSLTEASGTIKFSGSSADVGIEDETYNNLTLAPSTSGSPNYILGHSASPTITVSGNLTIGDATNGVTVSTTTYSPTVNVTGILEVKASATLSGSGTGTVTVNGNVTGAGTINLTGGTLEQRAAADKSFGSNAGSNDWTVNNLTFSNSDSSLTFGNTTMGGVGNYRTMTNGYNDVATFSLSESAVVSKLTAGLDGGGNTGNQVCKGNIYSNSSGNPNTLLGTSSEITIIQNAAKDWYDLSFPSPVTLNAGTYWLGLHCGTTSNNVRFYYIDGGANSSQEVTGDTYSDGPINPWTGGTPGTRVFSIYATYIPIISPFGNIAVESSENTGWNDALILNKFYLSEAGSVTNIKIYLNNQGASSVAFNMRGAIYDDDGAGGEPSTLLGYTAEEPVADDQAPGWETMTFDTPISSPSGNYWITVFANEGAVGMTLYANASGGTFRQNLTHDYSTLGGIPPNPYSGYDDNATYKLSIYATYTPATTITTSSTGTGQIITNGTMQVGKATDNFTTTLDNNTNDRIIDANSDFTITSKGSFSAASGSTSFTIADDFTNDGTFTHSSGTITFDTTTQASLLYTANTTFYNLTIPSSAASKQLNFDKDQSTIIASGGTLTIQGTNCSGNRIFLDSETDGDPWPITVTGATLNIDYADIEDSAGTGSPTADNSTEDNDGNSGWTITAGACSPAGPTNDQIMRHGAWFNSSGVRQPFSW